jgi:hypothetical protein
MAMPFGGKQLCLKRSDVPQPEAAKPVMGAYLHVRPGQRQRLVRVSISCPSTAPACIGHLDLTAILTPKARNGHLRVRRAARVSYNMRPGTAQQVFFRLPKWALRIAAQQLPPRKANGYGCPVPKWAKKNHTAMAIGGRDAKQCRAYRLPVFAESSATRRAGVQATPTLTYQVLRLYRSDVASVLPKKRKKADKTVRSLAATTVPALRVLSLWHWRKGDGGSPYVDAARPLMLRVRCPRKPEGASNIMGVVTTPYKVHVRGGGSRYVPLATFQSDRPALHVDPDDATVEDYRRVSCGQPRPFDLVAELNVGRQFWPTHEARLKDPLRDLENLPLDKAQRRRATTTLKRGTRLRVVYYWSGNMDAFAKRLGVQTLRVKRPAR